MLVRNFVITCLLWFSCSLQAQEAEPHNNIQIGVPAHHYIAAHFATGYWANKGESFLCPVLGDIGETKIAIYAKQLNPEAALLAIELDRVIQKYPQLSRSFLVVSDEGQRSESMTDDELKLKMGELEELARNSQLKKLSLAYLQYSTKATRWRNSLRFFGNEDLIVVVIEPGIIATQAIENAGILPVRVVKPMCRYVARLNSKDLDKDKSEIVIAKALASLYEK